MKKKQVKTASDVASDLLEIRAELNVLKAAEKAMADELRKRMLKGEKQGLFRFIDATTMKVADAVLARLWAEKYAPQAIIIDAKTARQVFLGDVATYSMGSAESNGFVYKTTQTLREIRTGDIATEETTIEG